MKVSRAVCTATSIMAMVGGLLLVTSPGSGALVIGGGGGPTFGGTTCSTSYLNGDSRLGPAELPSQGTIAPLVQGYQPLAGDTPAQFLATYWDPVANGGSGGWRYPPNDGFVSEGGRPDVFTTTLFVGQKVDRFGSEFGSNFQPAGVPYADRGLPPMSLDSFDPAFTCDYHLYQVLKPFSAEVGPTAPAFGQRSEGIQYELLSQLLPGDPGIANVQWLVDNGYLAPLNGS